MPPPSCTWTLVGAAKAAAVVKACWSVSDGFCVSRAGTGRINPKSVAVPQKIGWKT